MSGILDSFTSSISNDVRGRLSKALGVQESILNKGISLVGPIILSSLNRRASSTEGTSSLLKLLPKESESGLIGNLLGSITGSGPTPADTVNSLIGPGANAIGGTISQKLGFNARPLLALAAPLIADIIGKAVKKDNIDANGLSRLLKIENDTFVNDPANKEAVALVNSAIGAGDSAVALRNTYDDAEWMKVRMGPLAAMFLVASSSPSGLVGLIKEFRSASEAVSNAIKDVPPVSVVGTAFGGGLTKEELEQIKKDSPSKESAINSIKEGLGIISQKSPSDVRAYRELILQVSQKVAEASKEGGFLGIGGTLVSKEEEQTIAEIRSALG
jgi:hypothetical protein